MVTKRNTTSKKIIDKLRMNSEKVISKKEIIDIINEYSKLYKVKVNLISLWTYLRKDNYIKRILGDYYYIYSLEERYHHYCRHSEEEMVYIVLKKMQIKWYLGLENALKENKITWQALNAISIINNYFSGLKKFGNSKFKFIKTKDNKFRFGLIKKRTNNGVIYFYSDLEKTYLDYVYYSYKGKNIKILKKNMEFKINQKKIVEYAKYYPKRIQELI